MMRTIANVLSQVGNRRKLGVVEFVKGLVLALAWQCYKRTIGFPLIIPTYTGTQFILRRNCITSSRFVYEGRPDEDLVIFLARFADSETAFVDVGGNVGLYTVLLSQIYSTGWIFEPNPVAAELARQNIAINDPSGRFNLLPYAVGAKSDAVSFPVLDSPLPSAKVGTDGGAGTIDVQMVSLDEILHDDHELVMKIDVEGLDAEVIQGARGHFAAGRVRACQFECLSTEMLSVIRTFLKELEGSAYELVDPISEKAGIDPQSKNLFLVRKDLIPYATSA